jgi:flagellar biosynthesis/type III secretory pathway protein FliH
MTAVLLKLARPVRAVTVSGVFGPSVPSAEQIALMEDLKKQKAAYQQACEAVESIAERLKEGCETIFSQRSEEIAKLAVEIARKVLMRSVEDGDYKIENIITELLQNAPSQQGLVVHLNPKDLAAIQQSGTEAFGGITFVPDNNIKRAECILENPKWIIKSLIDEHLEQIERALRKAV